MDFGDIEEIEEMESEDIGTDDANAGLSDHVHRSRAIQKKNKETIRNFLGKGRQIQISVIRPRFYSGLLAWAIKHYVEKSNWKAVKILGRHAEAPDYTKVPVDCGKHENALNMGYMLLENGPSRVVLAVIITFELAASVLISGTSKKVVKEVARGIEDSAQGKNLYQGKTVELSGTINFLKLPVKGWDDLALEPSLKEEIITNTTGFLKRREELSRYGIPSRRGILLAGEPGTGKTLISKIVMNESSNITCISADIGNLVYTTYIRELYNLAKDLKPSIVFMEDLDLIGENRRRVKGTALPQLLAELDGIEECTDIVTIATTNFLENIDDALRKRPSRFDRIIQIPLPSLDQRREFISYLSNKIPVTKDVQEYMACRSENLTPAQIQEVAYSLVIEHKHGSSCKETGPCEFNKQEVDTALELVRLDRRGRELGFPVKNGGNGLGLERAHILNSKLGNENNT